MYAWANDADTDWDTIMNSITNQVTGLLNFLLTNIHYSEGVYKEMWRMSTYLQGGVKISWHSSSS